MANDNWNELAAGEKADFLREAFKEVRLRQDGIVVRQEKIRADITKINGRISDLEARTAKVERVIAAKL